MDFRAAEPADVPAIAELLLRASPGRTLEHEIAYVRAYFEKPETVVEIALRGDEAVGVVSFEPSLIRGEDMADESTAYVRLLAVNPSLWGSGLATELMSWACNEMAEAGYERAYLWCGEANPRARRFYEREGWRLSGRRRIHDDWGSMLAYNRQLSRAEDATARPSSGAPPSV